MNLFIRNLKNGISDCLIPNQFFIESVGNQKKGYRVTDHNAWNYLLLSLGGLSFPPR